MIVTLTQAGWEVVYQRAHGLLASKIAHHWKHAERGPRWADLLAAITQHDNNQAEFWADTHLTDLGAPRDFSIPSGSPLTQASRVVRDATFQGRYVALLTAMHVAYLYAGMRTKEQGKDQEDANEGDKEMDTFLRDLDKRQRLWRKALDVDETTVERDYAIMNWCDRCSLILCSQSLPSDERRLEVTVGPSGAHHYLWQRGEGTLAVEPWPFEDDDFSVDTELSVLTKLEFKSDKALLAALEQADICVASWRFTRAPLHEQEATTTQKLTRGSVKGD